MVGKHDAARADSDARSYRGDLPDHDVRRGACDRRQVVMLGHPVTGEAEFVGEPGEVERVAKRDSPRGAGGDRGKIKNGEGNHVGRAAMRASKRPGSAQAPILLPARPLAFSKLARDGGVDGVEARNAW